MFLQEFFKYGLSKIAFPAFWEQFPAIFNWLKSLENITENITERKLLENITEVALGKQN